MEATVWPAAQKLAASSLLPSVVAPRYFLAELQTINNHIITTLKIVITN